MTISLSSDEERETDTTDEEQGNDNENVSPLDTTTDPPVQARSFELDPVPEKSLPAEEVEKSAAEEIIIQDDDCCPAEYGDSRQEKQLKLLQDLQKDVDMLSQSSQSPSLGSCEPLVVPKTEKFVPVSLPTESSSSDQRSIETINLDSDDDEEKTTASATASAATAAKATVPTTTESRSSPASPMEIDVDAITEGEEEEGEEEEVVEVAVVDSEKLRVSPARKVLPPSASPTSSSAFSTKDLEKKQEHHDPEPKKKEIMSSLEPCPPKPSSHRKRQSQRKAPRPPSPDETPPSSSSTSSQGLSQSVLNPPNTEDLVLVKRVMNTLLKRHKDTNECFDIENLKCRTLAYDGKNEDIRGRKVRALTVPISLRNFAVHVSSFLLNCLLFFPDDPSFQHDGHGASGRSDLCDVHAVGRGRSRHDPRRQSAPSTHVPAGGHREHHRHLDQAPGLHHAQDSPRVKKKKPRSSKSCFILFFNNDVLFLSFLFAGTFCALGVVLRRSLS